MISMHDKYMYMISRFDDTFSGQVVSLLVYFLNKLKHGFEKWLNKACVGSNRTPAMGTHRGTGNCSSYLVWETRPLLGI